MSDKTLQEHLKKTGMTQVELAALCGVSQPTVSTWIRGRVPINRVLQVARITGLRPVDLRPELQDFIAP